MSVGWDLQKAVYNSELPPPPTLIMLFLVSTANYETGVIPPEHSPALSRIARKTRLSKSTISEWLDALETGGWIKRERPPPGVRDERTQYVLLIGSPSIERPQRASRRTGAASAAGSPREPSADNDAEAADEAASRAPIGSPGEPSRDKRPPRRAAGNSPGDRVRQANPNGMSDVPVFGSPPGERDRTPDTPEGSPGGTSAVRQANADGSPGGHTSTRNSPSESSTPGRQPARARGTARRARRSATTDAVGATGDRRGTRLPPDFAVTEEMITWARANTPNVGHAATDAFIDHFTSQPGGKGVRDNWDLEWRHWMRRQQRYLETQPSFRGTPVQTAVDPVPVPRPAREEMCLSHQGRRKATCGLCRAAKLGMDTPAAPDGLPKEVLQRRKPCPKHPEFREDFCPTCRAARLAKRRQDDEAAPDSTPPPATAKTAAVRSGR